VILTSMRMVTHTGLQLSPKQFSNSPMSSARHRGAADKGGARPNDIGGVARRGEAAKGAANRSTVTMRPGVVASGRARGAVRAADAPRRSAASCAAVRFALAALAVGVALSC
jgi:hypothetical protein